MKYSKKLNKEQLKLMKAVELGDFEQTQALISKGCNPNFWTENAMAVSSLLSGSVERQL